RQAYSPPCEGGGGVTKEWSRSEKARMGWSLASHASQRVLTHLRVSDHPVCGASVASRLFINAAATPPLQGGECLHSPQPEANIHLRRTGRRLHTVPGISQWPPENDSRCQDFP